MRILIIGSGGREHALAWAMARSVHEPDLFIAPGNAGTASLGQNVDINASDTNRLRRFALQEDIDLTVVGPEQPLVAGLADIFEEEGLRVIGPRAGAARLEGSKAFAKAFMGRHGIPTASYRLFTAEAYDEARDYVENQGAPLVVKASGLAAGKGALVCETEDDALDALDALLKGRAFGDAGDVVVVEEFMDGEEASVFALCDGRHYRLLAPAQDHKRIGEGDTGPNTGGMGAYAPAPVVTDAVREAVCRRIIEPTLEGMAEQGTPYRGVLYAGLMITEDGPKVVEFNCRLGDPEAQVVLPLLEADLVDVFLALAEQRLNEIDMPLKTNAAATVVMASAGYPGRYEQGIPIEGVKQAEALDDVRVFQAGTRRDEHGHLVTNGGRVLAVTGSGKTLQHALDRAYLGVEQIRFQGAQFRRDIGQKGLDRA